MLLPCASDGPDTVPKSPVQPSRCQMWTQNIHRNMIQSRRRRYVFKHLRLLTAVLPRSGNTDANSIHLTAPKSWPFNPPPSHVGFVCFCINEFLACVALNVCESTDTIWPQDRLTCG